MLLVVGGCSLASFVNLFDVDRGFSTAALVAADVELPAARYPDAAADRARFFDALLDELERAPGVEDCAGSRAGCRSKARRPSTR